MGENVRTGRLAKGLGAVASRVSNEQGPDHEDVDEVEVQDGIQDQDQTLCSAQCILLSLKWREALLPTYIDPFMVSQNLFVQIS